MNMSRPEKFLDTRAIDVLRALACNYKEQVRIFPDYVGTAEELALSFSDLEEIYLPCSDKVGGEFDAHILSLHQHFDRLQSLSDNEAWTDHALENSLVWTEIRQASRQALSAIGVESKIPELQTVHYVRTSTLIGAQVRPVGLVLLSILFLGHLVMAIQYVAVMTGWFPTLWHVPAYLPLGPDPYMTQFFLGWAFYILITIVLVLVIWRMFRRTTHQRPKG